MERSIETIWQEGFLNNDALVAPKINNLYKQKSIDIVDKFKRMYNINLLAIVAFSAIVLLMSFVTEMAYMGISMFIIFNIIVIVNRKFKKKLYEIDKTQNSYQYLLSFNNWMKEILLVNKKLNRYVYPCAFLSVIAGFWFGSIGGSSPGNEFVNNILVDYPNTYLIFGIPLFIILGIIVILFLLSYFSARIGKWDFNIIYGRILKKLERLLAEMEELRS